MSSNVPWATQTSGNIASPDSNWNRSSVVNTPQTNPASWPQLGAAPTEQEAMASMQTQPQPKPPQDDTGWGGAPPPPSEPDNGASGWGRLPDNPAKPPAASGWGAPPSGPSWGQPSQSVDDGTALWCKSTATPTQQSGWGNQVPQQVNDSGASGWGTQESTPSLPTTNMQTTEQTQAPAQSNPPTLASTTQAASNSHPSSWAKAAAAGLSSSTGSSESPPAESEQDLAESSAGTTPLPTPGEPDPVQQLVNSHEGWGKKPIQQGTSWNVTDNSGMVRPPSSISNGTEAWGKPGGQMQSGQGWGESKPASNWGASGNYNQPPAPSQNWGVPPQQQAPQQQRPSYVSGNTGAASGWGDTPQNTQNITGRWNDMPGQAPVTPTGWGAPVPQQAPSNQGWGNLPPTDNSGASGSGWGAGGGSRPMQSGSNWGNNQIPQSPVAEQSSWGRPAEPPMAARRPSMVDNGTAAWGDPGVYSKVNLWDKKGKNGMGDAMQGQANTSANTEAAAKGWGAPPPSNPTANRPPSPKGWGDASPTRPNAIDNGTSGWGPKVGGDKWGKGGAASNWNAGAKPNMGGWGQPNEQQWPQENAPNSGWGQQIQKPDPLMKTGMDYVPRGIMPPQPNLNQQNVMFRNQLPPAAPPQLQHQFHQIQRAVAAGVIPAQVLNPQLMSPQHMQALLQLVNKATECQQIQMQMNSIRQDKNLPPIPRQQQLEHLSRLLQQSQQHIETQRSIIMQNVLQKTQSNLAKSNGALGGMNLPNIRNPDQSMMAPLNNMGAIGQALPSGMPISSSMPSPTGSSSRLINWKSKPMPGGFDSSMMPPTSMPTINPGPGGDSGINGLPYGSQLDDLSKLGSRSGFLPNDIGKPSNPPLEQSNSLPNDITPATDQITPSLTDIGPPEFKPGVPWKGFRHIDPESDPDITPGSVAIAKTMSINTVRDADQVLKRERSALSESSTGAQGNNGDDPTSTAPSSSTTGAEASKTAPWSTGANSATLTATTSNQPRASLPHDPWKNAATSQSTLSSQAPPFVSNKEQAPGWDGNLGGGWDQNQASRQGGTWGNQPQSQDTRGSWLVLTNINAQVDIMAVRQLCVQQGGMVSFQPQFPMEGMALVKYSTPDDAETAKKALTMHMAGSTIIVATVATEHDVNNFVSATGATGAPWSGSSGSGSRYVGSTGGFMSQAPQQVGQMPGHPPEPANLTSSAAGQPLWSNATPNNVPMVGGWQQSAGGMPPATAAWSGGGEDMSRIMSPMHSLLPENLLGGESM